MNYYKVVTKINHLFMSSQCHDEEWAMIYPFNNWARAIPRMENRGFGPLVFSDYDRAACFAGAFFHRYHQFVFECEVEGIHKYVPRLYTESTIADMLEHKSDKPADMFSNVLQTPKASVMVDRVKLTKFVGYFHASHKCFIHDKPHDINGVWLIIEALCKQQAGGLRP